MQQVYDYRRRKILRNAPQPRQCPFPSRWPPPLSPALFPITNPNQDNLCLILSPCQHPTLPLPPFPTSRTARLPKSFDEASIINDKSFAMRYQSMCAHFFGDDQHIRDVIRPDVSVKQNRVSLNQGLWKK